MVATSTGRRPGQVDRLTAATVHRFADCLEVEQAHAPTARRWLEARGYRVRDATRHEQAAGVDVVCHRSDLRRPRCVDYKVDQASAHTGRLFVELVSNDRKRSPGWATLPDPPTGPGFVMWCTPLDGGALRVGVLRRSVLRSALAGWAERYPERRVRNPHYTTLGRAVPRREVERLACVVGHAPAAR